MGLSIFLAIGCIRCHNSMALGGQMLARFPFKNRGNFLGKDKMQIFKVSILRNILETVPYFYYELGVTLDKMQIDEIYEFFKSLNGELVDYKIDD